MLAEVGKVCEGQLATKEAALAMKDIAPAAKDETIAGLGASVTMTRSASATC